MAFSLGALSPHRAPDAGAARPERSSDKGHLTNDKCFIVPGEDAYLLDLLNSKLLDFYFRMAMPRLDDPFNGGDMEFSGVFMERTPIAPAKPEMRKCLKSVPSGAVKRRL